MANVQILPKVGENDRREWKIVGAITDGDVGKPVKLSAGDGQVTLCADGDGIYGFIDSVERGTDGGLIVVTVVEKGTVRATASGTVALGDILEAGANTAAGTNIVKWGIVSVHAPDTTTAITLAADTFAKNWVALIAAGDGEDLVIQAV